MSEFEAKQISIASKYLDTKLKSLPKIEQEEEEIENAFKIEGKKLSFFQRLLNLIFKD